MVVIKGRSDVFEKCIHKQKEILSFHGGLVSPSSYLLIFARGMSVNGILETRTRENRTTKQYTIADNHVSGQIIIVMIIDAACLPVAPYRTS